MRVLVVNGYEPDGAEADTSELVAAALQDHGHHVDVLDVGGTAQFMSAAEHEAYHSEEPLLDDDLREQAALVQKAEALVFCYPTVLFTIPAALKAWLERVMVPGVSFVFDEANKVRPGLTGVRRLAVVTSTSHHPRRVRQARDLGRRTVMRTLRLNCHTLCRRTFVSLPSGLSAASRRQELDRQLAGW